VILLGRPTGRDVTIESLDVPENARVTLLGREGSLHHRADGGNLSVTLPLLPRDAAYVLRITPSL
jgi:hypothetical protein